jgi:hypothetical protein
VKRLLLVTALLVLVLSPVCVPAQSSSPGPGEPPGQRLILKDGSYQVVRSYQVQGDRVRFYSAERGDWEEIPSRLIDWKATEDWNHQNAAGARPDTANLAAQEAAELDREAAAERAAEKARQPEVAPGLRLPDESGVWGLDTYNGTPELVRIRQSDGDLNLDMGHSVKAFEIPTHGAKELIRLPGYRATVVFHVEHPVFYIALNPPSDAIAPPDALIVDTHGAASAMQDKTQQASPDSSYALVRLSIWKGERIATAQQLSGLATGGAADGSAPIVALEKHILPGERWMRLEPRGSLNLGQYTLIEILPSDGVTRGFNADGWDFGVNPMASDNKGSIGAITPAKAEDGNDAPDQP